MEMENIRQNKAGMILRFSIPAIIAMVLTSLITVTDGFFAGNYVGKEGITAINMGLPIIYLYLGVGLMISVGGSVITGMLIGSKDIEKSNAVFNQTILMAVLNTSILSCIMFIFFNPLLKIFHMDGAVLEYFKDYYMIMLIELPIMVINNGFGMFIRSEGNPQFFMKVSVFNVLINFILDYCFVKMLHMGIQGIAIASLVSTAISLAMILYYFVKKSRIFKFKRFILDREVLKNTILNGSSEFIGEMSSSITMYGYNYVILKNIGVDGVTAFTIVGYVAYIFSMIIIGFGQGASPLISFVHGAKEISVEKDIRRITNKFVFSAGAVIALIMVLASGWYSQIFIKNDLVQMMVKSGIKIFVVSFLFSGINTISSFYFTSIGKAKESAVISSLRGIIILLICIFTLPKLWGMTGVWLVAPVTEVLTLFVSLLFLWKNDRQKNEGIEVQRHKFQY